MLAPWKKSYDSPRQHIRKQRHYFTNKGLSSQNYGFPSDHVQPKNWCFQTVMLEKTLESPLDCKEIKPVNPNGNQPWIFIGRTDAEAEVLIFGHPMQRADLLEKTLMLRKTEGRKRRGRQDEMFEWHNWLDGRESEWTPGVGDEQGGLACWVTKSRTRLSNWTLLNWLEQRQSLK